MLNPHQRGRRQTGQTLRTRRPRGWQRTGEVDCLESSRAQADLREGDPKPLVVARETRGGGGDFALNG